MKTIKPGIRLKDSGKYYATKSIDGKRYYKEFKTLREAEIWKNKFHPLANKVVQTKFASPVRSSVNEFKNGRDNLITVREVYEKYVNGPLTSLGEYSRYKLPKKMERFLPAIFSVKMADLSPEIVTELMKHFRRTVGINRTSLHEELKDFRTILNWYKDEMDFTYSIPITKHHFRQAKIKQKERKKKHISPDEIAKFIDLLPRQLQILATIQFIYALRIAEVCALTTDTVDFKNKKIHLKHSMTWVKDIPALKLTTKTEDDTVLKMGKEVEMLLKELDKERPDGCKFFFHSNGGLPRYRPIVDAYNLALKTAGIKDVSGTHFIRHSAATLSRKLGGIDAAQAILRHKSATMAQHYAKLDMDEVVSEVVINAEKIFTEARRASNASKDKASSKIS